MLRKADFQEQSDKLKISYLTTILRVENLRSVQAAVSYASVLSSWGLDPDNYPLFLEVLEVKNRWVIDALTEGSNLEDFLQPVIPTPLLVKRVFAMFAQTKRGGMYPKVLTILLGFLEKVYRNPREGYALYDLNAQDVNAVAKFLDEEKDQDTLPNRIILDLLRYWNQLDFDGAKGAKYETAKQAGLLRSNFFDSTRSLIQSLTDVLLEVDTEFSDGIRPDYVYEGRG